ncbi:elongator complex protein 5-like [Ostrea edulis]|uniref:elongator complex protein 5-like n=1 Tax=Ostrea edulis TaxID=37623 RepID=UPI002095E58B|nr:elongator complex protein 5-like [Ostrea edulis]
MIGDLISGSETSKLVLIEDSVNVCGRNLLLSYILSLSQRTDEVHLFSYDVRTQDTVETIKSLGIQNVRVHDGSKDLLGWDKSCGLGLHTDVKTYIKKKLSPGTKSIAIVMDTLSPLLTHKSPPFTCRTLHGLAFSADLGSQVQQVVGVIHGDLHDDNSLSLIHHTVTTIHRMVSTVTPDSVFCCNTLHKKISGKVIRIKESFNITEDFRVTDVTEVKQPTRTVTDVQNQLDPAANLPFNLSLSEKEKEARNQLVLPYTYNKERQESVLAKSVGEGKIFYQPDEADDFDEEDPDDDLDI